MHLLPKSENFDRFTFDLFNFLCLFLSTQHIYLGHAYCWGIFTQSDLIWEEGHLAWNSNQLIQNELTSSTFSTNLIKMSSPHTSYIQLILNVLIQVLFYSSKVSSPTFVYIIGYKLIQVMFRSSKNEFI